MSQTDINVSGQQETPVVMATEASAIRRCSILPQGNARSASEGGKCLADRPKTLSLSLPLATGKLAVDDLTTNQKMALYFRPGHRCGALASGAPERR